MFVGLSLVIHRLAWLCIICVINNHKYLPFIKVTMQSFFSLSLLITLCSTRVMRRVPLVEQELLIIPENPSSYSFFCAWCCSIFCPIVFDCYLWFIFISAIAIFSIISTLNCNILYICTIALLLLHMYKRYLKVGSRSRRMGLNGTCAPICKGGGKTMFLPLTSTF